MTQRRLYLGVGLAVVILGAAGAALLLYRDQPASGTGLQPDDSTIVEAGRQVYVEHCAACHGAELEGQPNWRERRPDGLLPAPPHDASGHTWHHPSAQLIQLTKYGPQLVAGPDYQSEMPAYEGKLSDREIVAVLSFIKSTWPPEIRRQHDTIDARAAGQ